MRLVTFNLLHGRSLQDGLVDAGRLQDAVRTLDADVLGLQEVDRDQPRSHSLDLTALAAAAAGAGDWRFEPALLGTPGAGWRAATDDDVGRHDTPAYGVGLVSRLPVLEWHVFRLPAAPRVRSPILLPGSRRVMWLQDEPRIGLAAVVASPVGPMTVATTHLSFVPGWNVVQLRRLVRELRRLPGPRLLLGDLNLPGSLPGRLTGWRSLVSVRTYPQGEPSVQLDHVLGHGQLPPVVGTDAREMALSDHRALVVELADSPVPAAPAPR